MKESADFEEWHHGVRDGQTRDRSIHDEDAGIADVWGDASEPVGYRRPGRPDWLAPALVIAVATLAFITAWFLTRGGDEPAADASRSPDPPAATSPAERSQPSSSVSSASSSAPRSSTSSAQTSASFPANAVATCGAGQTVPTSSVRLAEGTSSTCAYVADVASKVKTHLAGDSAATSFTIQPYSEALGRMVPLTCSRANHLSYCTGGTNVRLWVSDAVG